MFCSGVFFFLFFVRGFVFGLLFQVYLYSFLSQLIVVQVVISCEDFETRARELAISEVSGFYKSAEFMTSFKLVGKEIIKVL